MDHYVGGRFLPRQREPDVLYLMSGIHWKNERHKATPERGHLEEFNAGIKEIVPLIILNRHTEIVNKLVKILRYLILGRWNGDTRTADAFYKFF